MGSMSRCCSPDFIFQCSASSPVSSTSPSRSRLDLRMPSPYDSPPDIPADPFIIESSPQFSHPSRFEPVVPSNTEDEEDYLKPFIGVFRLDPFTTHDGVHGRPIPASARARFVPEEIKPIMLEFQLSLGKPSSPTPESESNSEADPTSPPGLDVPIKPGPLRYLDGDTAPSPAFLSSPLTQPEATTGSPVPLFHPHPQPPRQSFPQFDSMHRSPVTLHTHTHFNDQDHPFTRVDRTPVSETSFQQSSTLMYPPSLAYYADSARSGSESMYAPQSTVEAHESSGYRYAYSSSHTSSNGGYPVPAGSYSYSRDNQTYASQAQQSFSLSFGRNDGSSHDTFATPAQMSNPSRQEGIYPSAHGNPGPGSMSYPDGNSNSTERLPSGHAGSSLNFEADNHYRLDHTQFYDGNRREVPFSQNAAQVRDIKFASSSPHQPQADLMRRLPLPASYDSHSHEPYFQTSPRGFDQVSSRGYEQDFNGFEQPTSEPRCDSRPPSSVFDRRRSLTLERSTSRTSSVAFGNPPSGAFSYAGSGITDSSPHYLVSHLSESPGSDLLDRTSSMDNSFARHPSIDSFQAPGTVTPMRIYDSPAPIRFHTISPTPPISPPSADRRIASRTSRSFPPFSPGGMNRSNGGRKHCCTVCDRSFARPSTLATHLHTHTGEKPHLCPVKNCGRSFSVPSNLRRHVRTHKLPGLGPVPCAERKKTVAARKEPAKPRARVLQERKNAQSWCPESLRGMRNVKNLSSRAPFEMPEGAAPLRAPLPVVQPHGQPGDENYEDRDSFFYAYRTDQPIPYHPLAWELRPTLPGPLPSHADREARARSAYEYRGAPSGLRA